MRSRAHDLGAAPDAPRHRAVLKAWVAQQVDRLLRRRPGVSWGGVRPRIRLDRGCVDDWGPRIDRGVCSVRNGLRDVTYLPGVKGRGVGDGWSAGGIGAPRSASEPHDGGVVGGSVHGCSRANARTASVDVGLKTRSGKGSPKQKGLTAFTVSPSYSWSQLSDLNRWPAHYE